jgi:hypothetical protein
MPVTVRSLQVNLREGLASFKNVTLLPDSGSNSTHRISTVNADIDISVNHDVTATFASNTGIFCFHGRNAVGALANASCAAGLPLAGTYQTGPASASNSSAAVTTPMCTGQVMLCANEVCANSNIYATALPQLSVTALYGAMWLSAFNPNVEVAWNSSKINGFNLLPDTYMTLSLSSFQVLAQVKTFFDTATSANLLATLRFHGLVFPTSGATVLYASNTALLELEPHWAASFSGGLLTPSISSNNMRVLSGFCPAMIDHIATTVSSSEPPNKPYFFSQLSQLLRTQLAVLPPTLLAVKTRDTSTSLAETSIFEFFFSIQTGAPTQREVNIISNLSLVSAVLVSWLLSASLGIALSYISYLLVVQIAKEYSIQRRSTERFEAIRSQVQADSSGSVEYAELKRKQAQLKMLNARDIELPHFFRLPDFLIEIYRKSAGSSLDKFLKQTKLFKQHSEVSLSEFSKHYEAFVQEQELPEQLLDSRESLALFQEFHIHIESRSNNSTIALTHVRFKEDTATNTLSSATATSSSSSSSSAATAAVDPRSNVGSGSAGPGGLAAGAAGVDARVSSLNAFYRSKCVPSPHDSDFIFLDAFMEQYKTFCENSRPPLRMELVTDNLLKNEFGISQHRMSVRFLIQDHMEVTQEPFFLKQWCTRVRANMLSLDAWSTRDFFTVLVQLGIIFVLPLATSFPCIVSEYVYVSTCAIDVGNRMSLNEIMTRPWHMVFYNGDQVNLQNLILVWLSFVFYAVMLLDLVFTIVFDPLEDKQMFAFRPRHVVWWERGRCCQTFKLWMVVHYLATAFAMVYFASMFGYAVMVSVWFVLGACIRPEVYLAYAAAASSLITFSFWSLFESVYLVMHWSDFNYNQRPRVLHTILVRNVFSLLVPCTRMLTISCPRSSLKNPTGSPWPRFTNSKPCRTRCVNPCLTWPPKS